jgi:hypothetical protein
MKTPYDVLGVPRNASPERIRTAFRKGAKAYHPDLNAGDPNTEQQLRLVIAAYELLRDPQKRMAYDQYLRNRRRARVRHFAMPAVAGLFSGGIVALAVWLSVSLPNMQGASATPQTQSIVVAKVSEGGQQVAQAAADHRSGRHEVNSAHKSDWGAVAGDQPRQRPQSAGNRRPTAGHPEPPALVARELEQVQASGDSISAFAARIPDTPETGLAGSELIAVIDAAAPPSSNALGMRSLEERAAGFVSTQISGWSSATAGNLGSLAGVYADKVLYYGSRKSRQAVLLDKRRHLERWPQRIYDVQRDSITVECLASVCKVGGIVSWQTRNDARTASASGISQFEYKVALSRGAFRIVSESSSVIKRYGQEDRRSRSPRPKA